MPTLRETLRELERRLATAPNSPHPREAETLLAAALQLPISRLAARADETLDVAAADRLAVLLRRRLTGEPIQYLLGEWDFFGRTFAVDERALIPRPDTETLVEAVLELGGTRGRLLDLGTGTGILAITLALERPDFQVTACDRSSAALALARVNVRRHRLTPPRFELLGSDWESALAPALRFDTIVANPPYLAPEEIPALALEVRGFEPVDALADPRGALAAIGDVLAIACRRLVSGGLLAMEIGYGQAAAVATMVGHTALELVAIRPDLAGIPRVVLAQSVGSTASPSG